MKIKLTRAILAALLGTLALSPAAFGDAKKKGYRCEKKEDGKWVVKEDVKSRKECKKEGGKWVKVHSHDHDDGGHSHDDDD